MKEKENNQSNPATTKHGMLVNKNGSKFLVAIDRFVSSSTNDNIKLAMHLIGIYMAAVDYDKVSMFTFIRTRLA
ncbi:MAG: hypothetical protein ACK4PR_07310, partial [Gammaproteobacteria bacterium]